MIAGCVLGWASGLWALRRLDDTPAWWPEVHAKDGATIAAAEHLERAFANQISLVRAPTGGDEGGDVDRESDGQGGGAADWWVGVTAESANAWLAVRLRAWAENEGVVWPAPVEAVRVGFLGDRVALGARVRHGSGSSVVWMTVTPEVRRDGSVWLKAHGARVGGLAVPGSWALAGLEREIASHAKGGRPGDLEGVPLRAVLAGKAPVSVEPVIHLPDGRDVRILELRADGGRVVLCLRTGRGGD